MASVVLLAAFVLVATAVHIAGQQGDQSGFLSIDCGLDAAFTSRDTYTDITYVSDVPYVDGGEKHRVSPDQERRAGSDTSLLTLRSFPTGAQNCYSLPTQSGAKYLLRLVFFHGKYDGTNALSSSVHFDLHLGTNYWDTVANVSFWWSEAVFVAWASWVPVCLLNTGSGTPFVNKVELRQLGASMYPDVTPELSMATLDRVNSGGNFSRYPNDPYDRYWLSLARPRPSWAYISTQSSIAHQDKDNFEVPTHVLQTAITVVGNGKVLNVWTWKSSKSTLMCRLFLHFTDFQTSQLRQFNISINDDYLDNYNPRYLTASVWSPGWSKTANGQYNITLAATNISLLPPMINAYEVYNLIPNDTSRTFSKDFDAMMAIKLEYGVKKNWMGDPCFPSKYAWDGVNCSNSAVNSTRIISLDLSSSNLIGPISDNFKLLTELQFLDLSGNSLVDKIPDTFCKRNAGTLIFRYKHGEDWCNQTISPHRPINRRIIVSVSVVVPMVAVAILVLSYFIWRGMRNSKSPTDDPPPELQTDPESTKNHGDHLQNTDNRRFTYKELEKYTNKFEWFIGKGGFGLVYYGCLEDGIEVAVKIRSESSSHGLEEFLAEVHSLTMVHHRNLVSLIGYCWQKEHLALVYEYMSRGNLWDHLRGKNGDEPLDWATRVRIVLEAAQGLDYLHKGCKLPIIHRDVKTRNILLDQNLRAKVADFGLCKTYISETQTHISTIAAGSEGYFDPEYYHTGRLTESSDVYSFGVVLLVIATGEPPILPGHGHIVQRVKQKVAAGNISSVADARLGGAYEVTSMWKVVDTAMACTTDASFRRPTMSAVVVQLKESLALEEAHKDSGIRVSPAGDIVALVSTSGPLAR